MSPPRHAEKFSLIKRRIVKKREEKYVFSANGTPKIEVIAPVVTVPQADTAGKRKLFQAVWRFYLGTKLKMQASEGNARKDANGKFTRHKSPNRGMADLKGGYNGITYEVEQKQPGELHLESQKEYAEWVRSYGGVYITARTFEDIYDITQRILSGQPLDKYEVINTGNKRTPKGGLFD